MTGRLSRIYHGNTEIKFIARRRLWFTISALVILACLASLFFKKLNLGIEFEGGVSINAPVAADGPLGDASSEEIVTELRDSLESFDAGDAQIQVATDEEGARTVLVQTKEVEEAEQQAALVSAVAETVGSEIEDTDSERIGSKWGGEITRKALTALGIFMVGIVLFITWRFEWKMALAAVVALIHDMTITAGIYSFVGFEVTPSTVIALLTILGYSLYDTVVVFDKVEEDTEAYATTGRMTYQDAADLALNQVFMRSLNTTLSTLLPVGALLFVGAGLLGAQTLKDLALALFVGLLTGAYSSIFLATPLLSMLKEREPRYKNVREKLLRDAKRSGSAPVPVAVAAGATDGAASEAPARTRAKAAAATSTSKPSPARPKAGTKKAKRRRKR